jgi:uncharacterized low-complexity protein
MNRVRILVALAAAGAALLSSGALAQSTEQISAKFSAADKDGDGKLTLAEAKAGMPKVAANFAKIDRDKKGYVTLDQIVAMMKR